MSVRLRLMTAVIAISTTIFVLTALAPAEATTSVRMIATEMRLVGIDEDQAVRAGNRVVRLPSETQLVDGRSGAILARVPVAPQGLRRAPEGIVFGSCGSSYVYLVDLPGPAFAVTTGFDIDRPAVEFEWRMTIRGEYEVGVDDIEWSDGGALIPRTSWTSGDVRQQQDAPNATTYLARVASGFALTGDGGFCQSGLPQDARRMLVE